MFFVSASKSRSPVPTHQHHPTMTDTVASKIELFGKWSYDDVEINDISLDDYIAVNKKNCVYLPHTAGRYARKRFRKVCPRSPPCHLPCKCYPSYH